ncbi:phage protein NinX family protein [Escherichia coli]
MDYGKLSDQEINIAVAEILFPGYTVIESKSRPPCACITGCLPSQWVDYCNSPVCAWPIIAENRIALSPLFGGEWRASVDDECGFISYTCSTENPLRAAMTVFIMLQGSTNVQDNPTR